MENDNAVCVVGEDNIKAVIMAFLDPLTRQYAAAFHASSRSCAEWKKAAMDFASVNPMNNVENQMGSRAGGGDIDCGSDSHDDCDQEHLNALGKDRIGHFAKEQRQQRWQRWRQMHPPEWNSKIGGGHEQRPLLRIVKSSPNPAMDTSRSHALTLSRPYVLTFGLCFDTSPPFLASKEDHTTHVKDTQRVLGKLRELRSGTSKTDTDAFI